MLAGLLAGLFTKNPDLGHQEEILGALNDVEAELSAVETTSVPAAQGPVDPPVTPVTETTKADPVASVDIEALKAQFRADFQAESAYIELKQKAAQWDAHQAAIVAASTPAADHPASSAAAPVDLTLAQLEAKHKYI